jgi:hypothetical protein
MNITIAVKGTRPLVEHNERLANPLDPHTRRLKELTSKRKKTDEIIAQIAAAEQRGGYYETKDGYIGLPTRCMFASLKNGAKMLKLGTQVERALRFDIRSVPELVIDGAVMKPEEHMRLEQGLLYVGVRNKNNRVMRARPIFQDWSVQFQFELDEGQLNLGEMKQIAEMAGNFAGLCDWRPRFGTYEATITNGEVKATPKKKGGKK